MSVMSKLAQYGAVINMIIMRRRIWVSEIVHRGPDRGLHLGRKRMPQRENVRRSSILAWYLPADSLPGGRGEGDSAKR